MSEPEPFTGTWTFQPARSTMNAPGVQQWVQHIVVIDGTIRMHEEVVAASGKHADVHLEARFDGKDYPVTGSSLADTVAYQRVDPHNIRGTGKKNGSRLPPRNHHDRARWRLLELGILDFLRGKGRGQWRGRFQKSRRRIPYEPIKSRKICGQPHRRYDMRLERIA